MSFDLLVMGFLSILHIESNSNLVLFFTQNLSKNTVIRGESICLHVVVKWSSSGLLWSAAETLSVLMCAYGERICSRSCLKAKMEKKQDNNSVQ